MANQDELFKGIGLAIEVQSAFGTIGANVPGLTTPLAEADGIVLGDASSGDAESGITLGTHTAVTRPQPDVAGTFTQTYQDFLRTEVTGLSIAYALQGNGLDSGAPDSGKAQPVVGIDAIKQCAGLVGAAGAAPVFGYTPRSTTIFATIGVWHGDLFFVYQDCSIETLVMAFTPGGIGLATANFKVGRLVSVGDGVTFPVFDYGNQALLAAPTVEGVNFSNFDQIRGFENLSVTIGNEIETFDDSNVDVTGKRESQSGRPITVDGRLYVETADSKAAMDALEKVTAQTADLTFQVGTAAAGAETLNAYSVAVNNLQPDGVKYDETGTAMVVELTGARATGITGGDEFELEYN